MNRHSADAEGTQSIKTGNIWMITNLQRFNEMSSNLKNIFNHDCIAIYHLPALHTKRDFNRKAPRSSMLQVVQTGTIPVTPFRTVPSNGDFCRALSILFLSPKFLQKPA